MTQYSSHPASPLSHLGTDARGYRIRRWSRSSVVGSSGLAVVVLIMAALPYYVDLAGIQKLTSLFILIVLASTWNLLAGYGGMLSIGQQAYIGVGAYGLVLLADLVGLNPFLAVPVAAVLAAIISLPISYLAFRLVGGYFAIGTWVIAEVLRLSVSQIPQLGAGSGVSLAALGDLRPHHPHRERLLVGSRRHRRHRARERPVRAVAAGSRAHGRP